MAGGGVASKQPAHLSIDVDVNICERHAMSTPSEIPDRASAITSEWMTGALATSFPGSEVTGL